MINLEDHIVYSVDLKKDVVPYEVVQKSLKEVGLDELTTSLEDLREVLQDVHTDIRDMFSEDNLKHI